LLWRGRLPVRRWRPDPLPKPRWRDEPPPRSSLRTLPKRHGAPLRLDGLQYGCGKLGQDGSQPSLYPLCFTCKPAFFGEPTSGLEPLTCSLRVCGGMFLRVADGYETPLSMRFFSIRRCPVLQVVRSGCRQTVVNRRHLIAFFDGYWLERGSGASSTACWST
jgi:hypothetical protein